MMIYVICRWDRGFDACINETARVTQEEADRFIAEQDNPKEWAIDQIDMPLSTPIDKREPALSHA